MVDIMEFQEIIQFLVSGQDPICTVSELAVVMNVAQSTVYGYKNEGNDPGFARTVSLNKYLVEQKDCHIIEKVFCITRSGRANGKITDELWNIHELSTDVSRHYEEARAGNSKASQKYFDSIQQIKEQIANLQSEGKNL